jgi:myo-inositol catabolism protein IolC
MENLGYTKPLYILPFDHRTTFAQKFFNRNSIEDLSSEEHELITEYKKIVYEGFKKAVQNGIPKERAAILIDEEFGDEILKDAKENGFIILLTTEKSGQEEFEFQYGGDFPTHIEKYNPQFVKVLIKYNPEDAQDLKKRQLEKLKTISDFCIVKGFKFLLEVLIIPTKSQNEIIKNSKEEFDNSLRPHLTIRMMKELQTAEVEPDVWKLEGFDSKENYTEIVKVARESGRSSVSLVVLGRGENEEKVDEWLKIGKDVVGIIGFAVGRTVFWQAILDFRNSVKSRDEAVVQISENFTNFYKIFTSK